MNDNRKAVLKVLAFYTAYNKKENKLHNNIA